MAQVTGLHLRNGVYQLRVVVPKDLQDHYGKSNLRQSLGTSSRTDAAYCWLEAQSGMFLFVRIAGS